MRKYGIPPDWTKTGFDLMLKHGVGCRSAGITGCVRAGTRSVQRARDSQRAGET